MNMRLDGSRCGLFVVLFCCAVAVALAPMVPAMENLTSVPEPTVEGEGVATGNLKENPTLYNLTVNDFQFHPYIGAAFGYDSNIYLTDSARVDDPFFQVGPGLLIQTNPEGAERFEMRWNSNFQGRFFFNESQANTVQLASHLNTTIKTSPLDINILLGGGRYEDPIDATFADRTPRGIGEALARLLTKMFDKTAFEAGYHFTYIDYHGPQFASLDRTENEVPVRVTYKVRDAARLYINSAWKLVEFRNPGLNNFYIVDSRAGFAAEIIEKVFTMDVNIGVAVARIKNDNTQNPSVRATHIVWDSVFQYKPREELAVVVALYGTPRVNLAVTQPVRPVYGARVDGSVKMLDRKLTLSAGGFYERIDNLAPDLDQTFLSGSLRARYDVRSYAFVYLAYSIMARQADGTVQDYVDNKILLGGGLTL